MNRASLRVAAIMRLRQASLDLNAAGEHTAAAAVNDILAGLDAKRTLSPTGRSSSDSPRARGGSVDSVAEGENVRRALAGSPSDGQLSLGELPHDTEEHHV